MEKTVFIAEKPSVAIEFSKAMKLQTKRRDGYLEADNAIFTWCVGHLITMSYPEAYDPALKKWSLGSLPFIPKEFKYEVIPAVKKQFKIVKDILNHKDVKTIYVCTDSGREGEYIYRLVEQEAKVKGKDRKRVWIDSQTEDEILRGIKEAKDLSAYDNLSASAYLRAKEDYLMGINFSRVLTLKYGSGIADFLNTRYAVISVGRVMTCVLGMVVSREREIRDFVKTPFYRVIGNFQLSEFATNQSSMMDNEQTYNTASSIHAGNTSKKFADRNDAVNGGNSNFDKDLSFEGEWRVTPKSKYYETPHLYKENGFKERKTADELIEYLKNPKPVIGTVTNIERKKEKKNPPLLYNLAELQNDCSKIYKISPDETLRFVQELYEKKLITYPRTDARVLSTAVAKEIGKNLNGLMKYPMAKPFLEEILGFGSHKTLSKSRYVNDKQITDHYAIIPTGQGFNELAKVKDLGRNIYDLILKRFLSIFYPPAVYQRISVVVEIKEESFFANFKVLVEEGYLKVAGIGSQGGKSTGSDGTDANGNDINSSDMKGVDAKDKNAKYLELGNEDYEDTSSDNGKGQDTAVFEAVSKLKKGDKLMVPWLKIKEGETTPPKRYNSGSIILAMENAGQLIEDEELRAQIKGSGIGTSATRSEILKKLFNIKYLDLNKKTQIITPTLQGEMIYDVVLHSISPMLNPELTASWEKGLSYVAEGSITSEEYIGKLDAFVRDRTNQVKEQNNQSKLQACYQQVAKYYKKPSKRANAYKKT